MMRKTVWMALATLALSFALVTPALACCGVDIDITEVAVTEDRMCDVCLEVTVYQWTDWYESDVMEAPLVKLEVYDGDGVLVYEAEKNGDAAGLGVCPGPDAQAAVLGERTDVKEFCFTLDAPGLYTYWIQASAYESYPPGNPPETDIVEGEFEVIPCMEIDIKPGSFPNAINPDAKGRIPVAILTTDFFDAACVDPDSIVFAGAGVVHCAMEDVDFDGDMDLIAHFKNAETNIQAGDTEACLTADCDGETLTACDSVMTVPQDG